MRDIKFDFYSVKYGTIITQKESRGIAIQALLENPENVIPLQHVGVDRNGTTILEGSIGNYGGENYVVIYSDSFSMYQIYTDGSMDDLEAKYFKIVGHVLTSPHFVPWFDRFSYFNL